MNEKSANFGGGFGGCTAVHLFSQKQGWEVTLLRDPKVVWVAEYEQDLNLVIHTHMVQDIF